MGTFARLGGVDTDRFPHFIETGTGRGVGIAVALGRGYRDITSIELVPEIAAAVAQRYSDDDRVRIICAPSPAGIRSAISLLPAAEGVVFWLDAHFPGSDVMGLPYDSEMDLDIRFPLGREMEAIRESIGGRPHIVFIDDLRCYGGQSERGYAAAIVDPRNPLGTWLPNAWVISTKDEGYALLAPRGIDPAPQIIDELSGQDYLVLARIHAECGDGPGTLEAYQKVLDATDPPAEPWMRIARGEACRFMASRSLATSHDGTACDWFYRAIAADPLCTEYRLDFVLGALLPLGWIEVARQEAERAVAISARYGNPEERIGALQVSARVQLEAGNARGMRRFIDQALELNPDHVGSRRLDALYYLDTGALDEALRRYIAVLKDAAGGLKGEVWQGIALALDRLGNTERAVAAMDDALAAGVADRTLARWNRAEMLLTLGRYREGWADHGVLRDERYRGRELAGFGRLGRRFKAPLWNLDRPDERVHVHGEMGFGDVICMSRYCPIIRDLGNRVSLEVDPKLVELFQRAPSFHDITVMARAYDYPGALGLSEFDSHITTMGLPAAFGTDVDIVPWAGPYLAAQPMSIPRRDRVALCWRSGRRPGLWHTEYARRKSMNLVVADRLVNAVPEADWVSLDFEGGRDAMSFYDTARILASCGLVITVDTATAHLAGAMGLPTWLMMHCQGSWHWMRTRTDSPWYPTVRIFRQERPNEWDGVVDLVAGELRQWCSSDASDRQRAVGAVCG